MLRAGKTWFRFPMALERYEIIHGNDFEFPLETGGVLRADWKDGTATMSNTAVSAGGMAVFTGLAPGNYYLACRESATDPWVRVGTLEVSSLVDEDYELLVTELANVNALIAGNEKSLIQYQATDPSGTAVTRMTLLRLTEHRGRLEARLANYERAMQGRPPVRFS